MSPMVTTRRTKERLIKEPHTFDPDPFPAPPDCAQACAEALASIGDFLGKTGRPVSYRLRIAALQVVLGRMNATDAARTFQVHRQTIYVHVRTLCKELGLEYNKGKPW